VERHVSVTRKENREQYTYGIDASELLLRSHDSATPLGCIQRSLALDNLFAGSSRTAASAGANLGHRVPVVAHLEMSVSVYV
jgi:hypothetical protein